MLTSLHQALAFLVDALVLSDLSAVWVTQAAEVRGGETLGIPGDPGIQL